MLKFPVEKKMECYEFLMAWNYDVLIRFVIDCEKFEHKLQNF